MSDKQFRRVLVIGALLLALLMVSFGLKKYPITAPYFINHSEIKDTTNYEYQKSLKKPVQPQKGDTANYNHVRKQG